MQIFAFFSVSQIPPKHNVFWVQACPGKSSLTRTLLPACPTLSHYSAFAPTTIYDPTPPCLRGIDAVACGVWPRCAEVAAQSDREHWRHFGYSRWHDLQQALWVEILAKYWLNSCSSLCIKMTHDYNADLLHFVLVRNYDQTICLLRPFDFCSFLS